MKFKTMMGTCRFGCGGGGRRGLIRNFLIGLLPILQGTLKLNIGCQGSRTTPTSNMVYEKPVCDSSLRPVVRYSSSSERIYLEAEEKDKRGGCMTLLEMWEFTKSSYPDILHPIDEFGAAVDTGTTGKWQLNVDLYVTDGTTLQIWGDVARELRLLSSSSKFINLRGYGGSLDIVDSKIYSWNTDLQEEDTNTEDGRSFISCISEVVEGNGDLDLDDLDLDLECEGHADSDMGECRMDIDNSELSYLGYNNSESWGVSYKVRGFCKDESNPEIFSRVKVYGNIYDSRLHHNYYGHYSYGHSNGDWSNNSVYNNVHHGFDPHDHSNNVTIHDNVVYNNGNHGIIASKSCSFASIQGNEIYGSAVGIFLHRSGDNALIESNFIHDNRDAGITLLESSWARVKNNVIQDNYYGTRISVGSRENEFSSNEFIGNEKYSVYLYDGSDAPDVWATGRPQGNVFEGNDISGEGELVKCVNSDNLDLVGNNFELFDFEMGNVSRSKLVFTNSREMYLESNVGLNVFEIVADEASCFHPLSDMGDPLCPDASFSYDLDGDWDWDWDWDRGSQFPAPSPSLSPSPLGVPSPSPLPPQSTSSSSSSSSQSTSYTSSWSDTWW